MYKTNLHLALMLSCLMNCSFSLAQFNAGQQREALERGIITSGGLRGGWGVLEDSVAKRAELIRNSNASQSLKDKLIKENQSIVDKFTKIKNSSWEVPLLDLGNIKRDAIGIPSSFSSEDGFKQETFAKIFRVLQKGDEIRGTKLEPLIDFCIEPIKIEVFKVIAPDKGVFMHEAKLFIVRDFDLSDVADGDSVTIDRICIAEQTEEYAGRKMWSLRCLKKVYHDAIVKYCIEEANKKPQTQVPKVPR